MRRSLRFAALVALALLGAAPTAQAEDFPARPGRIIVGFGSVQELIALAKSKPGEILYASTGVGTAPHLASEMFNVRAGIKTVHVPYQGSAQAATDLIAGRTGMMFSPATAVMPHIAAGTLKGLASATTKRPAISPNPPTMAEAGMPHFHTRIWFGLIAPARPPPPVIH